MNYLTDIIDYDALYMAAVEKNFNILQAKLAYMNVNDILKDADFSDKIRNDANKFGLDSHFIAYE